LSALIDFFGPLIFPLYKAALLRKRILIMHEAPVELACNFVYNISILSNIPSSVTELIPLEPLPTRLQPLFSVGIHDIDELSQKGRAKDDADDPGYGWIACSTDDVLTIKTGIYDVLVNIPPAHTKQAKEKVWPEIKNPEGQEFKASQRDLRRYRTLRQSIKRQFPQVNTASPVSGRIKQGRDTSQEYDDDENENAALLTPRPTRDLFDDASSTHDERLIEPMSWSALAYNSFMWWASAGEKRAGLEEEIEQDTSMFRDFNTSYSDSPATGGLRTSRRLSGNLMTPGGLLTDGAAVAPEMAIIAFFHRLTANIFATLSKVVESTDNQEESEEVDTEVDVIPNNGKDNSSPLPVYVTSDDMVRMGLDVWSDADKKFIEDLVELYWGRKAEVQSGRVECCGVRIL
jgi:hypothetical protein